MCSCVCVCMCVFMCVCMYRAQKLTFVVLLFHGLAFLELPFLLMNLRLPILARLAGQNHAPFPPPGTLRTSHSWGSQARILNCVTDSLATGVLQSRACSKRRTGVYSAPGSLTHTSIAFMLCLPQCLVYVAIVYISFQIVPNPFSAQLQRCD